MTDRVGETALTFLADVVHSQDDGTETHDDGNNPNKRKAVESSGVASRWLPQSNLMPLNSGCTDDQESQEGEVIGEMKGMMPSATLESVPIDNTEDSNDALERYSTRSKRLKRTADDDATKDMITGFFRKASDNEKTIIGDPSSSSSSNSRHGVKRQNLSFRRNGRHDCSSTGVLKREIDASRTNEQYAAEILTRIPSEDLHANSRDWQDSNFANGLTLGPSVDSGFALSAPSGELADSSLGADIFRSSSNSAFGRGVFSTDSLDVQDGSNNVSRGQLTDHLSQFDDVTAGAEYFRNRACTKCGQFLDNNTAHVCAYSKSPHLQYQAPGRKYFIDNSDEYNAFMLQKYTGISHRQGVQTSLDVGSCQSDPVTVEGTSLSASGNRNITTTARTRRVPLQIKLARSVVPTEMSMLGKDAKIHIAILLQNQLRLTNRLAPQLHFHKEFIEKTSIEQNQIPESTLKRTLTMTGGGMSIGPYQSATSGNADARGGQKLRDDKSVASSLNSSNLQEVKMVTSLIESMEEYAMSYAMRLKEMHEDDIFGVDTPMHELPKESSDSVRAKYRNGTTETLLENKFSSFTNQIENYLGPMFYTRSGVLLQQEKEPRPIKYNSEKFNTSKSTAGNKTNSPHNDVYVMFKSILKEMTIIEERKLLSIDGSNVKCMIQSMNSPPS
jgi:hypothetical protein